VSEGEEQEEPRPARPSPFRAWGVIAMGVAWIALGGLYTTIFDPRGMDFIDAEKNIVEHRVNYLPIYVGVPVIVLGVVWVGVGMYRMRRP
jgi:hypothetical protein